MNWAIVLVLVAATTAAHAEPLQLDVATSIRLALEHNPLLESARKETAAADGRLTRTRAERLPRVEFVARYTRQNEVEPAKLSLPSAQPDRPAPSVQLGEAIGEQTSFRAVLDQPLFTGFAVTHSIDAAREGVAAARAREEAEALALEGRVEGAYYGLVLARALAGVAARSVEVLERHEEELGHLVEAGLATEVERALVTARLAAARAERTAAGVRESIATDALLVLVGRDGSDAVVLTEPLDTAGSQPTPAEALVGEALAARPELAAARAGVAALDARASAKGAARWPTLALRAGVAYENPNARYFPPLQQFNASWDASLVLSWRVLELGLARLDEQAARAEAEAATARAAGLRDNVRLEVLRAAREVSASGAAVEASGAAVDAGGLALERAREACAAGARSCTAVLDAQLELSRSSTAAVSARVEARLAAGRLRRALGRSLLEEP